MSLTAQLPFAHDLLRQHIHAGDTVLDGTPATPAATPEQHFASTRPMATGSSQPQTDC